MQASWTLGAWMVVVVIPSLMVGCSLLYYLAEQKRIKSNKGGDEVEA